MKIKYDIGGHPMMGNIFDKLITLTSAVLKLELLNRQTDRYMRIGIHDTTLPLGERMTNKFAFADERNNGNGGYLSHQEVKGIMNCAFYLFIVMTWNKLSL